jgi:hypothetical protein
MTNILKMTLLSWRHHEMRNVTNIYVRQYKADVLVV